MRDIKFRAWQDGQMRMLDHVQIGIGQIGFSDTHWTDLNDDDGEPIELMQYTGLKDKNGVDIYEGDIVENLYDGTMSHRKLVEFNTKGFADADGNFVAYGYVFQTAIDDDEFGWSVIGNNYENPELLR